MRPASDWTVAGLGLDRFPVDPSGHPTFSDDFGAPRSGGRTHQGTDIFAKRGTPVVAVRGGTARNLLTSLGGNSVFLTSTQGEQFFYAHLDGFGENSALNKPFLVRSGDVLGFVGDTGNAAGTPPHLHFQMAEQGGQPVNPFPFLAELNPAASHNPTGRAPSSSAPRVPSSSARAAGGGGLGILVLFLLLSQFGGRRSRRLAA